MSRRGMSRREMIRAAGVATAAGLFESRAGAGQQETPEKTVLERRQPAGLKLSCSSLAYSDMKWDEALDAIKKLGFRYVELAMYEGGSLASPSALTEPETFAKRISVTCAKLEIEPVAIRADFALGDHAKSPGVTIADAAARKTMLAHFERVVLCARVAAIPLISVSPGKFIAGVAPETCWKNAVDLLVPMLAGAARRGLALAVENHPGSIVQEPENALRLLTEVSGLRLDYDLSQIVAGEISLERTLSLLRHVAHVGVRNAKPNDANLPVAGDSLDFDVGRHLKAFRDADVNAYVAVQYLQPELRNSVPRMKAILERERVTAT